MKKMLMAAFLAGSTVKMLGLEGGLVDTYSSYHVKQGDHLNEYLQNKQQFRHDLAQLLQNDQKYKAIWITLTQNQLGLAPLLIEQGFQMHTVNNNTLRFSKWMLPEQSRLPKQQSHYVGVGGVIIDDGKLLMVQEKNGTRKGAWGIPGGLVDQGESLAEAITREIKEETNLQCQLEDVLFFREVHQAKYERPDLYFALKMRCDNTQNIKICEHELLNYQWIPVNEIESFLIEQKQRPVVLNFYRQVQETLKKLDKQLMVIQQRNDEYGAKVVPYTVFKPKL